MKICVPFLRSDYTNIFAKYGKQFLILGSEINMFLQNLFLGCLKLLKPFPMVIGYTEFYWFGLYETL